MARFFRTPIIGLALSGGAARGLAHIGVIKVIEEEKIPVSVVAGTSVGSLIGALYASGLSWREIADIARKTKWKDLARLKLAPLGVAGNDRLKDFIDRLVGGRRFEDLPKRFAAVAVDLGTGRPVTIDSGSVADAVRASASIPGIFEPTVLGGRYLVDGGLLNNVPADVARDLGANTVIAVELNARSGDQPPPKHVLDLLYRCFQIVMDNNSSDERALADVVIAPRLADRSYYDLKPVDEMVALGEAAARSALGRMKKICRLK